MSQKNAYRSICARTASEGLKCKQWTLSGQKPSPAISDDELCLLIGGFGWFLEVDSVPVKIPPLHFGKSAREKLPKNTQIFKSSGNHKADMESLISFCPKLTKKIPGIKCQILRYSYYSLLLVYVLKLLGMCIHHEETSNKYLSR